MPLFFLPNEAVEYLTRRHISLDVPATNPYTYGLYVSPHTPVLADVIGTYTAIELAAGFGYTQLSVASNTWVGATAAGVSEYVAPTLVWTFTANAGTYTIYGVFGYGVNNASAQKLIGAQLLVTPYAIPAVGGVFAFTPTWSEESQ